MEVDCEEARSPGPVRRVEQAATPAWVVAWFVGRLAPLAASRAREQKAEAGKRQDGETSEVTPLVEFQNDAKEVNAWGEGRQGKAEMTIRRSSEDMTENDVLRDLLDLGPTKETKAKSNGKAQVPVGIDWISKRVTFSHGTEFRAEYKGKRYNAKVENGALIYNGQPYKSPSEAAMAIVGYPTNGWVFWDCKMPGRNWTPINRLRKTKQ